MNLRIGSRTISLNMLMTYMWSLVSMFAMPAVQFLLFAFYARVLGVEQYGIYIALMAWAPICLELVSMGAGEVLIKRVARDPSRFAAAAGHFVWATAITLPFALALYWVGTFLLVGERMSWLPILVIGLCELLGFRLFVVSENCAIAIRNVRWANEFRLMQALPRALGVAVAFYIFDLRGVVPLAMGGSLGILIGGCLSAFVAWLRFPHPEGGFDRQAFGDGVWFAGNQLARAGQQNIDRVVLGWLIDPALLAVYGAAQRFVQVGILPIQAILRMTYPHFFAHGHKSIGNALRFGIKVLFLVCGIAASCAAVLWLAAMFVPDALGHQFLKSASYLRWLAPSLILIAANYVAADILTGSDHQRLRTTLMVSSIAIQAAMFALFHQGNQLIFAAYAGIGFAAAANWTAVLTLTARERGKTASTLAEA